MKRLPLLLSFLALVALTASLTYWVMQWIRPPVRDQVAVAAPAPPPPAIDAAATLFGGQASSVVSNYQLTGVVAAGRESVAIIVADGALPKALKLGKEVVSGVTVQEVHPRYVMLSDGGVLKRIELAADGRAGAGGAGSPPPGQQQNQPQQPQQQQPQQVQQVPQIQVPQIQQQPQQQPQPSPAGVPPPPPMPPPMPAPMRGQAPNGGPAQLQ
ncbi:MAG: hypothetical protein JWR40_3698 [Massilia sp.]|jgi:general secretion pathway protein C|nr:hypothetical protein [Massilia sp.]